VPALMENLPGPLHVMADPAGLDAEQHAVSGQIFGRAGHMDRIIEPVVLDSHHAYG
jgi:hypothetical protein